MGSSVWRPICRVTSGELNTQLQSLRGKGKAIEDEESRNVRPSISGPVLCLAVAGGFAASPFPRGCRRPRLSRPLAALVLRKAGLVGRKRRLGQGLCSHGNFFRRRDLA